MAAVFYGLQLARCYDSLKAMGSVFILMMPAFFHDYCPVNCGDYANNECHRTVWSSVQ